MTNLTIIKFLLRIVVLIVFYIVLSILGFPAEDYLGNKYFLDTDTDDEADNKKGEESKDINDKDSSRPESKPANLSTSESPGDHISSRSENKPSEDISHSYRVGDLPASSGTATQDIQKRLERLMLDHTADLMSMKDSEIKANDLHTKDPSQLTTEESNILKDRESDASHMADTSARLMNMELEDRSSIEREENIQKRDAKSADMAPERGDNKKAKGD